MKVPRFGSVGARCLGAVPAFVLAVLAPGCEALPEMLPRTCGNSVVDPGEACDSYAPGNLKCGGPNSSAPCRYVCEPYGCTDCCPAGEACGVDGVCHRPAGSFLTAERIGDGSEELTTGDLDGDHRLDVIAANATELTVRFGAEPSAKAVTRRQDFQPMFLPVAVGRAEAGGADLVVPRHGLVSLSTDEERNLTPASLPAFPLPAVLDELALLPPSTAAQLGVTALIHATIQGADLLLNVNGYGFAYLGVTWGPPSELAGPAVSAALDTRPESPCDDVVMAWRNHEQVEFFNPCRPDGPTKFEPNACDDLFSCPEDMPRRLQVGAKVALGPQVAQMNPEVDDHLDVVVQTSLPDLPDGTPQYEVRVAYGVGDGTFHSERSDVPLAAGNNTFGVRDDLVAADRILLALGDLDGEGDVDVVTQREVQLGNGEVKAVNAASPWHEAVIADLNANGINDVMAVDDSSRQAFFFNGVGGGVLNPMTVATQAPLTQLRVGDFDGDLVGDVVAVANGVIDAKGDWSNQVSVLFGRPAGAPEQPVVIGKSQHDFELTSGTLASGLLLALEGIVDGMSDVLALASKDGVVDSVSVFLGRGDREIRSPLGFMNSKSAPGLVEFTPYLPRRVTRGRFVEPDRDDLAVVTVRAVTPQGDYEVWLVPELGAEFTLAGVTLLDEPLQQEAGTAATAIWELGMYVAIDLDGDGLDELVAMAPLAEDPMRSAYRIGRMAPDGWQWLPADDVGLLDLPTHRYAGPTTPCRDPYHYPGVTIADCAELDFTELLLLELELPASNGRLLACDVDGVEPRRSELVMLSRMAGEGEPLELAQVLVRLGGSGLELATDDFIALPLLQPSIPFDLACLQMDTDPAAEILVLTDTGLWRVELTGSVFTVTAGPFEGTKGYHRMVAGDVDGDGLDDVVLANESESVLLRAVEVAP